MEPRIYYVYILTNHLRTVLYIGVTNDLFRRLEEHRAGTVGGFSSRYRTTKLVYFEETSDVISAIEREKQLKGLLRWKKERLINQVNPYWNDLAETV